MFRQRLENMRLHRLAIVALALMFSAIPSQADTENESGFSGRLMLVSKLDEPDGFCLDVPGPPSNPMVQIPAWVHTCHPEPLLDQVFYYDHENHGQIKSLITDSDLCLTVDSQKIGSGLKFAPCKSDSEMQSYDYLSNAMLQLRSTKELEAPLCLAAEITGPPPRQEAKEGQDPRGESRPINPSRSHLARFLQLQLCSEIGYEMGQWEAYQERPASTLRRFDQAKTPLF